jgi:hypothetical protein
MWVEESALWDAPGNPSAVRGAKLASVKDCESNTVDNTAKTS